MSCEFDDPQALDQRLFDRLADGELGDADRRELLSRLDQVSDGWRRCALAFLEAQAWRNDMRLTACKPNVAVSTPENFAPRNRMKGARVRRASLVALALVAAFAGGWLVRPGEIVDHDAATPGARGAVARSEAVPPSGEAASEPRWSSSDMPPGVRLAGVLALQIDESGQPHEVQIPVLEGPGIDGQWLLEQPPAIGESVVKELERRGHRVEARRQLLTVDLKDGRKVLLPVDQVDVRLANRVYQ